jgi:hypothetical protein
MSDRRHTDKHELAPWAVRSLGEDHPAMTENRTIFPTTVVNVSETKGRLLISGDNNRKIGEVVEKGQFKGYGIFMLTLEERATCPADCSARGFCYGNGMQMARRNRIDDMDAFYDALVMEINQALDEYPGVLIRLHVLGDFFSVEYVALWKEIIEEMPQVAVFGYTHRKTTAWGGDEIGDAIEAVKDNFPDRFRIRWSFEEARPDGATIIDYLPETSKVGGKLVCPSQMDSTACCATCGLCWEKSFARECIAFIKHGPKSGEVAATNFVVPAGDAGYRKIEALPISAATKPALVSMSSAPKYEMVNPTDLSVEPSYQRDLSGKSISLIKKIVAEWDWAKFKPPVCVRDGENLFVIDGQHTAIAAATSPNVTRIPVMIVENRTESRRAQAFVSQNTDRVAMTPLQILHAEVTAGNKQAVEIVKEVMIAGGSVPKSVPMKGKEKPGEFTAVSAMKKAHVRLKKDGFARLARIAVATGYAPVNQTLIRSLEMILADPFFKDVASNSDEAIATAYTSLWASCADMERQATKGSEEADIAKYPYVAHSIEARFVDAD